MSDDDEDETNKPNKSRWSKKTKKLFEYYKSLPGKTALCKLCNRTYTYKSTSNNLKTHLKLKHRKAYIDIYPEELIAADTRSQISSAYFRWYKVVGRNKFRCHMCLEVVTAIQDHLKRKHPADFQKLLKLKRKQFKEEAMSDTDEHSNDQLNEDADTEQIAEKGVINNYCEFNNKDVLSEAADRQTINPLDRESRVSSWDYFDKITLDTAQCRVCLSDVSWRMSVADLREHLLQNHPEVAASLNDTAENDKDAQSPRASSEQVIEEVYLEFDEDANELTLAEEIKNTSFNNKPKISKPQVTKRKLSVKEDCFPAADDQSLEDWHNSLDKFGLYVSSLMRMLPRSTAKKFQVQIIERLLNKST